jgi:hypothetical protein
MGTHDAAMTLVFVADPLDVPAKIELEATAGSPRWPESAENSTRAGLSWIALGKKFLHAPRVHMEHPEQTDASAIKNLTVARAGASPVASSPLSQAENNKRALRCREERDSPAELQGLGGKLLSLATWWAITRRSLRRKRRNADRAQNGNHQRPHDPPITPHSACSFGPGPMSVQRLDNTQATAEHKSSRGDADVSLLFFARVVA